MRIIKGSNQVASQDLAERLNGNQTALSGDNRKIRRIRAKMERNKSGSRRMVLVEKTESGVVMRHQKKEAIKNASV